MVRSYSQGQLLLGVVQKCLVGISPPLWWPPPADQQEHRSPQPDVVVVEERPWATLGAGAGDGVLP